MNDKKINRKWIKLGIYLVLFGVLLTVSLTSGLIETAELKRAFADNGAVLVKLLIMVLGVLIAGNLMIFVLGSLKPKRHRARSILSLVSSAMRYVMFIVIVCTGLRMIGVDITAVIAGVGVLALVIGFSAESLIADVVTGTFMLLENQYNVGDIVEVNGFRGTVTSIGVRTTCITDMGDNVKIINNSQMQNILNRSDKTSVSVCDISIPYETDIEALEAKLPALLNDIYDRHPDVMQAIPSYSGVQALEASGILLRFVVSVSEKDIYSAARILNRDLLLGFKTLGVECPYPQMDVHTK